MTRENAIICLKGIKNYGRDTFTEQTDWQKALDIAIKALEQESCTDAISRQEAIDAIHNLYAIHGSEGSWIDQRDAFNAVNNLPPAQRQSGRRGYWKHINEEEERAKHNGQLLGWMPWYCSECGSGVGKHQTPFCPNCGADMRGERNG